MITVGTPAPDFALPTQTDTVFRLSTHRGKANVLILFIPAAFTPICSTELPALDALQESFQKSADTAVVAITADHAPCNRAWVRSMDLGSVPVLSDFEPKGQVSQAYGAWLAKDGLPDRATVIVGKDGRVKYAESVGKFGKRSVPALLEIARAVDGRASSAPPSVKMPLDLPVLLVSGHCPHCRQVLDQVRSLRLEGRIVVRDVDTDLEAFRWLLDIQPDGSVPVLRYQGKVYLGAIEIGRVLPRFATIAA
jgi:peroxiredoxin (alkyl hydroperoxide reductase subunit C)